MKQLVPRKFDRNRFLVDVEVRCMNGGNQFKAHAIDLGQAGMALFAKRFIGVGESVELIFRADRSSNAVSGTAGSGGMVLGSVAYARVESDGNILGIAFARALSSQEMQALQTCRE